MEVSLRHATLAATNQRTTATIPEKALAWTSLQRLRHNLEELQSSGPPAGHPAHAEQYGHRVSPTRQGIAIASPDRPQKRPIMNGASIYKQKNIRRG